MQPQRRRSTPAAQSIEERLAGEARRLREEARRLPPGAAREAMLRKARQAETGSQITAWIQSPGLRAPE